MINSKFTAFVLTFRKEFKNKIINNLFYDINSFLGNI